MGGCLCVAEAGEHFSSRGKKSIVARQAGSPLFLYLFPSFLFLTLNANVLSSALHPAPPTDATGLPAQSDYLVRVH